MSNKDSKNEKEKSFPERLKRFLKSDKKNLKNFPEIKITEELRTDLGQTSSIETRMKAIRDLEELVQVKKLQDTSMEKVWIHVQDLLQISKPPEVRHAVLSLFSTIAVNSDRLGQRRIIFLKYIMDSYLVEDTVPLFRFFQCIINNGKDLEFVEEEVGPFLIRWLPSVFPAFPTSTPVIDLITTLLKFNAAHIDDHIIHQLVLLLINQLYQSNTKEELYACLKFMETLIAYAFIPSGTLTKFVSALARLVSIPFIVEDAWKVMRNLLRTDLGNSAICSLSELIETSDNFHIVRGSIYFIASALWSKKQQKIYSLSFGPISILPTLRKSSESRHPLVIYETAISISRLVRSYSHELHLSSWDLVLDVLERLFYFTANYNNKEQAQMIFIVLNGTVDIIENKIESGEYGGALSKFYNIIDCYSKQREIPSVLMILEYKIQCLQPKQSHWLMNLTSLVHRHFREDPRPPVRLQALSKLRYIFDKYKGTIHAEQICETVVVTQLDEIEKEPEMNVRKAGVSLLAHIVLSLQVPVVGKILTFIEKIVLAPYVLVNFEYPKRYSENEVEDVFEGIKRLILIFKKKIWMLPSSYAIQAYHSLLASLELHYRNPEVLEKVPSVRREIFEMIFEMRADADYHFGLPDCPDAQIPTCPDDPQDLKQLLPNYTPYIVVDHKYGQKPSSGFPIFSEPFRRSSYEEEDNGESSLELQEEVTTTGTPDVDDSEDADEQSEKEIMPIQELQKLDLEEDVSTDEVVDLMLDIESVEPKTVVTHLSLTKAAMIVIVAMKKEKDWALLKMILEKVPQVLQNKALILSKDGSDIDYLATTLCALLSDEKLKLPESLHNTPQKFSRSDLDSYVYPVMASLASYHQHLDALYQRNIIQCLQNGMSSKSAPQCVSAMTLCVLEMRSAMTKLLRDVMMQLSRISATVQNAQPTLEFLSTLLHLPRVYADFLPSQYLSVFAISIPYTNPFKFNHYIVSLAYHVICMWFMKCRVPHRRGFVNFISKNLNMILVNEMMAYKIKPSAASDQAGKGDADMIQFHKDLRETCVDFMARNCFDSYAPETIRSPVSQMLFNRGQQQMWLLGTRIITVTMSGCSKKPIRQGLCDKCVQYCLSEDHTAPEVSPQHIDSTSASRRRHKSDFHRSVSHEAKSQPQSKDDLHMRSTLKERQYSDQSDKLRKFEDFLNTDQVERKDHVCSCWCTRWAEIMIRQPTGNVSYAMRILNPLTNIAKEDLVPVQDLSSFYSPFAHGENPLFGKDFSPFHESLYDLNGSNPSEAIRPRALSGGSERTQTSETGLLVGEEIEWSNSGSGPSSGAASLASSETKLNVRAEAESNSKDPSHSHVFHCASNPEVYKGLMEAVAFSEQTLRHIPLAHSTSLAEEVLRGMQESQKADEDDESHILVDKPKTRGGGAAVKRCNSSVGSPSSSPAKEQAHRTRHYSALQAKSSTSPLTADDEEEEDLSLQPMKRDRGHTISEMNPASRNRTTRSIHARRPTLATTCSLINAACIATASTCSLPSETSASTSNTLASSCSTSLTSSSKSSKECRGGTSPSAVFLQLYYQGCFGASSFRPILLPINDPQISRAISVMDKIKPHVHYRIGVLYVGPKQTTEAEIFANTSGSERYHQFLDGIGSVYEIKDFSENTNLGGLDKRGVDGHLIHMWQDDLMQVVFHVATTMPNKESDPNGHNKKQHIGNNYVTIVYNNSGCPYDLNTIKSQFNHTIVEIIPGDHSTNCINLLVKPDLAQFVSWENNNIPRLVSDASLALLVRQLALHATLASTVWESLKRTPSHPYANQWMVWLRKVRKLRETVLGNSEAEKHLQEMQLIQDPNRLQTHAYLDFSDMIEIEKSAEIKDVKDRSRTATFLNRRLN